MVHRLEALVVRDDFLVVLNGKAHGGENLLQLPLHQRDGVVRALALVHGQGDVVLLGRGDLGLLLGGADFLHLLGNALLHLALQLVDKLAHLFFLVARHRFQAFQQLGDRALLAQVGDAQLLHGLAVLGGLQLAFKALPQGFHLFLHVLTFLPKTKVSCVFWGQKTPPPAKGAK